MDIRNEITKASSFLTPFLSSPNMVIPERETPGKKENPCNKPIKIVSFILKSSKLQFIDLGLAKNKIKALIKKHTEIRNLLRKYFKAKSLIIKATKPLMKVIRIILVNIFLFRINLRSLTKNTKTEKSVARCKKMKNETISEGSEKPNLLKTLFKRNK